MVRRKTKAIWEFGDFQTPDELATEIASALKRSGVNVASIVEPTCGKGSLLISTLRTYPNAERAIGADINAEYLRIASDRIVEEELFTNVAWLQTDFFITDWENIISKLPEPILIVGNPPWVTSSDLSALQSTNVPEKSNFQGHTGLNAITGKSNFDISEWMLLQNMKWLQSKIGTIAMLCKTAVARKILLAAWKGSKRMSAARIYQIDARRYFDAAVDACLLVLEFSEGPPDFRCQVFRNLSSLQPEKELGYCDNTILSNSHTYTELRYLLGEDIYYTWRSGVKHDCSKVMEVEICNELAINGNGDSVALEYEFLYPMFKSSDIGNNRITTTRKYMLVTQKYIGEDTGKIKGLAPKTWDYLQRNKEIFARRGSSIYTNRPVFSIFGVGDYTFTQWKVAISGFYKRLIFVVVGPIEDKPVVFDDTIYFLPCLSKEEAVFIAQLLNSELAKRFYESIIFWEDKRPITAEVLKKLNVSALASVYDQEELYRSFVLKRSAGCLSGEVQQLRLLEKSAKYHTTK